MRHRTDAPGVVLSPHPDDAVLSAWSALRRPEEVLVVGVCTGLPPAGTLGAFDPVFGVEDSRALMVERLAEDAAALASAGRSARHLDLLDAQYRDEPLDPSAVASAIAAVVDDARWLGAPAGIGGHPDHVGVRDAALALAREAGLPLWLYADQPYAAWAGWPHWVTGRPPRPHLVPEARWEPDLASLDVPRAALVVRPIALDEAEMAAKLAALRRYGTQFAALDAGPLGRLRNPEILGFEVHWDVELGRG